MFSAYLRRTRTQLFLAPSWILPVQTRRRGHCCTRSFLRASSRAILNTTYICLLWRTKSSKVEFDKETYPVDFSFEYMLTFIFECKGMVKFFHNHHVVKVELHEKQKIAGVLARVRPCPIRWGTIQQTCKALIALEQLLYEIVSARDLIKGMVARKNECTEVKQTIVAPGFVSLLKNAIEIVMPLDTLIVKY